jgi:Glycosyl transferase family group 2
MLSFQQRTSSTSLTIYLADTHLSQDYFNEIRSKHWRYNADAQRAFYASPIIFDRNSNDVPILVRCADLLWAFAGISAMYPGCSIIIPTSVYSLPLALAQRVGGWDGDPTAIGEDMHMLLKCYFETAGDIITHVIASPASQCNIESTGDGNWGPYASTLFARYRQALRHMWGSLDTGYSVRQSVGSLVGKRSHCFRLKLRHLALFHLLFEAHLLPCHLTILLLFSTL